MDFNGITTYKSAFSGQLKIQVIPGSVLSEKAWGDFKVQRAWWQELIFALEDTIAERVVSEGLTKEVRDFMRQHTSDEFHKQKLTTRRDIQAANSLINKICGLKNE